MDSLEIQIILLWASVTFYVVATVLNFISIVFNKPRLMAVTPWLALIGFVPHTAAIILRWVQTGHFLYWGKYEVYNSQAWGVIGIYLLIMLIKPTLKIIGTLIFPVAFFTTGIALVSSPEVQVVPSSFLTYWLVVHVAFAKLAYGSGLISAFFGGVYLVRLNKMKKRPDRTVPDWLPSLESADYYTYRFAIFCFITLSIMIGAGSIWAYKAWGRYWGWDPVETWSLVSWFAYGILLHLRATMGWKGKKVAWLSIVAAMFVVFAFFGLPLIYDTIHEFLRY
jgi:cytochrome c-type biogenesis protein CcsB